MKKIFALVLVLVTCFTFCACDNVEKADEQLIFNSATQAVADYVDDAFGMYPDDYDMDYEQKKYQYTVKGTCKDTNTFKSVEFEVQMTYDPAQKSFEIDHVSAE